jgi:hypothetical protein
MVDRSKFSVDSIRAAIDKSKASTRPDGPSVTFLPEGQHKIRWFFDPEGEIYREVVIHRAGRKWLHCPDWLSEKDPEGAYPPCGFCQLADDRDDWKIRRRFNYLVYGYLVDTKQKGEYWQAGNAYMVVGNTRLKRALMEMLEALVDEGEELLLNMLTPDIKGYVTTTTVTKGSQGNVSIQILPTTVDPIELGDWYKPLAESWVSPTFNLDEFRLSFKEFKAALAEEDQEAAAAAAEEEVPEVPVSKPAPKSTPAVEEEEVEEMPVEVKVKNLSPKVNKPAKAEAADSTLPDGVTLDMLPEECPGWAKYNAGQPVCVICDYNIECMG